GPGILPLGLLLSLGRVVGRDHDDRALHLQRRRALQQDHRWLDAVVHDGEHRALGDRRPQRVDDVRNGDDLVPRRPAVDPYGRLRGCRARQHGGVAHVLEDHVSAVEAGALLRPRRVRHRRAQGLRPGLHRFGWNRRAELRDVHGRPLHLRGGVPLVPVRHRSRSRRRPIRHHLRPDRRAAPDRRPHGGVVTLQTTTAAAAAYAAPRRSARTGRRILVYVLLIALSLLFFVPFIWSLSTSFKTIPDSVNVHLIPNPFTTSAWHAIWTQYDFKLFIRNSLFLAVV